MTSSFPNHDSDELEGLQDEPEKERRRSLLWALLALLLLCIVAGVGGAYALNNPSVEEDAPTLEGEEELQPEPTDAPTEPPTEQSKEEATEAPTDAPTEEPTEEPTVEPTDPPTPTDEPRQPVVVTDAPTAEPTDPPVSDPCANNGGLQWQGQYCACDGRVVIAIFCQDGAKSDNFTDQACTPNPADCPLATQEPTQCCIFFETQWYCGPRYCGID